MNKILFVILGCLCVAIIINSCSEGGNGKKEKEELKIATEKQYIDEKGMEIALETDERARLDSLRLDSIKKADTRRNKESSEHNKID